MPQLFLNQASCWQINWSPSRPWSLGFLTHLLRISLFHSHIYLIVERSDSGNISTMTLIDSHWPEESGVTQWEVHLECSWSQSLFREEWTVPCVWLSASAPSDPQQMWGLSRCILDPWQQTISERCGLVTDLERAWKNHLCDFVLWYYLVWQQTMSWVQFLSLRRIY